MALFKIFKGLASNLPSSYTEGYCYFTTDDAKLYIDTDGTATGRKCLNGESADIWKNERTFTIGDCARQVDGSQNVSWPISEIVVIKDLVGSSAIGSTTQPIYWTGSAFAPISYTIQKSVPSDAKFTDTNTTYTIGTSGTSVTLKPSSGDTQSITVPYATKAAQDSNGSTINVTYLKLAGGTMSGNLLIGNNSSSATTATQVGITVRDLRSTTPTPDFLGNQVVNWYFDEQGPSGDSSWKSIMHMKGWTGTYAAWELAGPASTTADNVLYFRSGISSTWNDWKKIAFTDSDISGTAAKATADASGNVITTTYSKLGHTHTATTAASASTVSVLTSVKSAGTVPTLGTEISADDITKWSAGTVPTLGTAIAADDITSWNAGSGSYTQGEFDGGSGSYTQGSFSGGNGSFSFSCTTTTISGAGALSFSHTHNAATHGKDSHTHNAATHGEDVHGHTVPSLAYTARSIPNVTNVGTVPTLEYTARSIPNITNVGSMPTFNTGSAASTSHTHTLTTSGPSK